MNRSMFDLRDDYERLASIAAIGYDPDTGETLEPEDLAREWEAIQDEAAEKVLATGYVLKRIKAQKDLVDEERARLKRKSDALEKSASALQDLLRAFMEGTRNERVKGASLSVSLGKPTERVEVAAVQSLPAEYLRYPDPEPRKAEIRAALKEGKEVPGASLVPGPRRLTIR